MEEYSEENILKLLSLEPFCLKNISESSIPLYVEALTHSSYANEKKVTDNERLEFLGNYVLDFIVADHLYNTYSDFRPGDLNKGIKITANKNLAKVISNKNIFLNKETMRLRKDTSPNASIRANALEALVGAIYLDRGINTTRQIILRLLGNEIEETYKNHRWQM
jgi:ribonuclease-3